MSIDWTDKIPETLKELLDEKEMKATEVSKKVAGDRYPSLVTKIIKGHKKKVDMATLARLAAVLGISVEDFIARAKKNSTRGTSPSLMVS